MVSAKVIDDDLIAGLDTDDVCDECVGVQPPPSTVPDHGASTRLDSVKVGHKRKAVGTSVSTERHFVPDGAGNCQQRVSAVVVSDHCSTENCGRFMDVTELLKKLQSHRAEDILPNVVTEVAKKFLPYQSYTRTESD